MDALREEFKELLRRSGWNQSEAARNLDLPAPSVSRYMNDIDTPSKQTIRLFKMLLADQGPTKEKPAAVELREEFPRSDLDIWRTRAQTAERELTNLKTGLRALLDSGSPAKAADPGAPKVILLGNKKSSSSAGSGLDQRRTHSPGHSPK